ncbi:cupin-like domain-containing protein [Myroides odoratimimus]|uniref:cupin-like domain-containing protein n=1 Tax=Myroides odoratimimus TaxID=76832 RepID=UPI002097A429|nr:cupin-like domain-containing protein [Myroides odoratimimus]MCO7721940.1 cupin-like domain-containing protein [Myroides odoratimimus]MDM1038601.1 cupin-like domain-containing protein [Myroides odoratimimus]MDM1052658.1 cupin-like domain-containing protein [Myroides odoratimimus]MDM1458892.1 cupin-like domain-containing protein [Myroides odoratimimus]
MKKLQLQEIERVKSISEKDFIEKYLKKQIPVVIENLTEDWPAYKKWRLNYIKEIAGEKLVPLYDDRPVSHKDGFNEAHATMKMADYIDLLNKEPTNYRIFLYNIMKEVPTLKSDFKWPKLGLRLVKQLPMLFFGGTNSKVFMHFDIDYSNILHFNFNGEKQCMLFSPDQTKYMYKIPHALISREDIDFDNPDFDKWPALKYAKGYICNLKHGEMLYMPEGYWHYMKYLTPSISMSLRAFPSKYSNLGKAIYNITVMRYFDNFMRRLKGQDWIDYKNKKAIINTHKSLGIK